MTPNEIVHSSRKRGLLTGASGIGLVLALGVIGYGIVKPPELASRSASAAVVAAVPTALSSPARIGIATPATSATPAYRAAPSDPSSLAIDSARECAPDAGIANACIFN